MIRPYGVACSRRRSHFDPKASHKRIGVEARRRKGRALFRRGVLLRKLSRSGECSGSRECDRQARANRTLFADSGWLNRKSSEILLHDRYKRKVVSSTLSVPPFARGTKLFPGTIE